MGGAWQHCHSGCCASGAYEGRHRLAPTILRGGTAPGVFPGTDQGRLEIKEEKSSMKNRATNHSTTLVFMKSINGCNKVREYKSGFTFFTESKQTTDPSVGPFHCF